MQHTELLRHPHGAQLRRVTEAPRPDRLHLRRRCTACNEVATVALIGFSIPNALTMAHVEASLPSECCGSPLEVLVVEPLEVVV